VLITVGYVWREPFQKKRETEAGPAEGKSLLPLLIFQSYVLSNRADGNLPTKQMLVPLNVVRDMLNTVSKPGEGVCARVLSKAVESLLGTLHLPLGIHDLLGHLHSHKTRRD